MNMTEEQKDQLRHDLSKELFVAFCAKALVVEKVVSGVDECRELADMYAKHYVQHTTTIDRPPGYHCGRPSCFDCEDL